jgi:hypothetical protein
MLFIGTGMKGKKGDDYYFKRRNRKGKGRDEKKQLTAVYNSVRNAWNNFCAWCVDNGHPISLENKEHMTKVRRESSAVVCFILMLCSTISDSSRRRFTCDSTQENRSFLASFTMEF